MKTEIFSLTPKIHTFSITSCPFCKGFDLEITQARGEFTNINSVGCKHCHSIGPFATTQNKAIEVWNKRGEECTSKEVAFLPVREF